MIKPTIGRVVWYHPNRPHKQPLAALVTHVWSDTCINLVVFDENGVGGGKTSVLLVQEGNPVPTWDYCEWMPYQKTQAGKYEAVVK